MALYPAGWKPEFFEPLIELDNLVIFAIISGFVNPINKLLCITVKLMCHCRDLSVIDTPLVYPLCAMPPC
jgi:hypothetical protein